MTEYSWLRAEPAKRGRPTLHLVPGGLVPFGGDTGGTALCGKTSPEWVGRLGVRPAPRCAACRRLAPSPCASAEAQIERTVGTRGPGDGLAAYVRFIADVERQVFGEPLALLEADR